MKTITKDKIITVKNVELEVKQTHNYDENQNIYYDDVKIGNNNLREIRNVYREYANLLTDVCSFL